MIPVNTQYQTVDATV